MSLSHGFLSSGSILLRTKLKKEESWEKRIRQEHQNFCNPFFDHFLRQHSPVPILIGFFKKRQEPDEDFKTDLSSSAKQVVHPAH
jgi:hypothetical protein